MIVLGIESSCDETAAALVNDKKEILGEALLSQEEQKAYLKLWTMPLPS